MALPVGAYGKHVHAETHNVLNLLAYMVLQNNLIRIAGGPDSLDSRFDAVVSIGLSSGQVKFFGRYSYYEVISQSLCSSEQVDMPLMQKVESPVSNYFLHTSNS